MAFWNRLFRRKESRIEAAGPYPDARDRELIKQWVQGINDSVIQIRTELEKIPSLTLAAVNQSFEDRTHEMLTKLDGLPEKIIGPLGEIISLSKREVLAELVRISSHYSAHDSHHSHDSIGAQPQIKTSIQVITSELTGKQKRLLAILLDSGFLSYSEIGGKLGITHESAKNLVNRLLKDEEKARIFSKQETDRGIVVGVSSEVQDEILKKKYRTTPNDST
jgi:DNA-binding MarR family transcriptional regulator